MRLRRFILSRTNYDPLQYASCASHFCATQTSVRDTSFEHHGWKAHNITRYFVFNVSVRSFLL